MIMTTTYGYAAAPVTSPVLGARHREVRAIAFTDAPTTGGVRLEQVRRAADFGAPVNDNTTVLLPVQGDESVHAWRPPV